MGRPESVLLTGMMGAGKTTCGQRLAQALQWPFIDLDVEIEKRVGMSPSAIFQQHGEPTFRRYEHEALKALHETQQGEVSVIALGGGTWHQEGNQSLVKALGSCVFLDLPESTLAARLQGPQQDLRPLLTQPDALKNLVETRRPGYLKAEHRVCADASPAQVAVDTLNVLGAQSVSSFSSLHVSLGERSYPVWIGQGGVAQAASLVSLWLEAQTRKPTKIMVVTDSRVEPLYLNDFLKGLETSALLYSHVIPEGEGSKSLSQLSLLWDELLQAGLGRSDLVIALGGGVVGDLASFAASTLMRGVRVVQVPTTVLSQVDSSVGGKTGINHTLGKNLIGAFHQPSAVIMSLGMLRTLDPRQVRSGLAEVIKAGVLQGEEMLCSLEERALDLVSRPWEHADVIARCCALKADVVARDERESGARAMLNLGHTFGHAMEAMGEYGEITHGEAVGLGLLMASRCAVALGLTEPGLEQRLRKLLIKVGLPTQLQPWWERREDMVQAMLSDKKRRGQELLFVLPLQAGRVVLHPVAVKKLTELLARLASMEQEP